VRQKTPAVQPQLEPAPVIVERLTVQPQDIVLLQRILNA